MRAGRTGSPPAGDASLETHPTDSALADYYARIDAEAARVARRNEPRLSCHRGCSGCCLDDLTVSPVEAENIERHHRSLLTTESPHPEGACAFLDDESACRIYAHRPAVCRSHGLPLRVLYENEDEEIVERRDICELNVAGGPPLAQLAEEDCWLIGPFELELGRIERAEGNDDAPRVRLRDLFRRA